ncbi:maleylpyruvate isomerase [Rhodobacterales bacterium HKCCE4037]|nr:maleylpyruvate isomerase [Rhodobacterales bacterium HKCCE4037]
MSTAADRAALVARQGAGARYDAAEAPAEALLLARRGTAYFARVLNGLSDQELSELWRAEAVVDVGYHARGLAEALAGLRTGAPVTALQISTAAVSLPARALRGLFHHSAIHLDVEWRDLPGAMWSEEVPGMDMAASETPLARARLIWRASLRLGGRERDLPEAVR